MSTALCAHLSAITEIKTSDTEVCAECVMNNTSWVHLRVCQTCGVTLCCDSSPQTHMTKHYHQTQHPVVTSAEAGERWLWCYPDEAFAEY